MERTAIVYIAERCNQRCVFCLEVDKSWAPLPEYSEDQVAELLRTLRERGTEHITFMGGETFFRKDIGAVLSEAKRLGITRLGVTTNGTILSKPGMLRHLVDCGLDFIEFSLHGHTPELANRIGGTTFTFQRQAKALAEINEIGLITIVNVVICRENKDHLVDIARYLTTNFPRIPVRFKFKFVELMGLAATQPRETMLRYSEVDAIAVGDYLAERGVPFWYYNFPLCRLGRHAAHSLELATMASDERYFDYDHQGGTNYLDTGYQLRGHCWPMPCPTCTVRPICSGIENAYRIYQGTGELRPRDDDPLPILTTSLQDLLLDGDARERLEALRREPRPLTFEDAASPAEASNGSDPNGHAASGDNENTMRLRFESAKSAFVVELRVERTEADRPAYARVGSFSLSYVGKGDAVREQPGVSELLAMATQALEECDSTSSPEVAGAVITKAVAVLGWVPTTAMRTDVDTTAAIAPPEEPVTGDAAGSAYESC